MSTVMVYAVHMFDRVPVQIRMNKTGVEKLDEIARAEQVTRSDVIRVCLAIALADPAKIHDHLARKKANL